jgi:hypothetical protein
MRTMKKIFFITMVIAFSHHAKSQNAFFTTEYSSLTVPQIYHGNVSFINSGTVTSSQQNVDGLKHDNTILPSFPLVISAVTIYQSSASGTLTLASSSVSAKDENYIVLYDFTQTQQLTLPPDANGSIVGGLIGISVRMTARIHTKKKGINLGNLFGLGISASQDKLTGSLEVKAFGMSSQKINELIPVPADLSTGTIQNALSAVATIKSHIYDDENKITPLWLAFNITGSHKKEIDFDKITNDIQNYR